jgi:hypothetical protein
MNQLWKVPVATLRVFEAAARWQSFHAAASELNRLRLTRWWELALG